MTELEIKKDYRYGEQRLLSFAFSFETRKTYIPNFEDLYTGHKDTVFERFTNDTKPTVEDLNHEFLHELLFEFEDKKTSLDLDNIDKGYGKDGEFYILSKIEG